MENDIKQFENLVVRYFSGTGNTRRLAEKFADSAAEIDPEISVDIGPVSAAKPAISTENARKTILLFATATHGFTAPWAMIKYTLLAPLGRGAAAVIITTRAGMKFGPVFTPGISASATFLLAIILFLKGYRVRGVDSINMPSNWIQAHPGLGPTLSGPIIERGDAAAERLAQKIFSGRLNWFTLNNLYELIMAVPLAPVSVLYLFIGRFMLAKIQFADNRCNGCGICEQCCPTGSITLRGKNPRPYVSYSCECCLRCMSFCPTKSIQTGHSWAVLLFMAASTSTGVKLAAIIGERANIEFLSNIGEDSLLLLLYYYPALFLSYFLFWQLVRVPLFAKIFSYTSLSRYWKRYHEPTFTPKKAKAANAK